MGSFSQMTVSDYPICTIKNGYIEELVKLVFTPDDFIIEERDYSSKNKLIWGDAYEKEKGKFIFRGFKQSVKNCKDRLCIYGVSSQKAKIDFQKAKKAARAEMIYDFQINKISWESYVTEISDIITKKEINYEQSYYSLRESLISDELGFYGQETKYYLYSILSAVPEDAIVEYDMSDLIDGGWINEKTIRTIDIEKIIVLTEGKTDVEFISTILSKLFPHLLHYYHFIDFDEYKVESNASALVKLVVSLAASNVKHPIIALFDNDTAGIMEMKKLLSLKLPDNIKILKLPDLDLAKKYPTIGPTGQKRMNINGLACGIEMYLGIDVLTKDNKLIPIQWKAFNEKERKYQGEISEKQYVHDYFRRKIKNGETLELSAMELLLTEIINAFKKSSSVQRSV